MHQFICNSQEGNIVPLEKNKRIFFKKLLNSYQELNKNFKVTIELISKDINEQQYSLYKAYILKASEHFGNGFYEMARLLERFHPLGINSEPKNPKKWSTHELNDFIDKSSALLSEHGFQF